MLPSPEQPWYVGAAPTWETESLPGGQEENVAEPRLFMGRPLTSEMDHSIEKAGASVSNTMRLLMERTNDPALLECFQDFARELNAAAFYGHSEEALPTSKATEIKEVLEMATERLRPRQ